MPVANPPQSRVQHVKIYGERNAGTNYLAVLLQRNYFFTALSGLSQMTTARVEAATADVPRPLRTLAWEMILDASLQEVRENTFGWKHAAPPFDVLGRRGELSADTLFVVISKHPLDWLRSFYKRPYHALFPVRDMAFSDFLRHPWLATTKDDIHPALAANPIDLWNRKYRAWLELAERGYATLYLRYADLLADLQTSLGQATPYLRRNRIGPLLDYTDSTKGDGKSAADFRASYLATDIFEDFAPADVEFYREHIDRDVLARLGYALDARAIRPIAGALNHDASAES